MESKGTFHASYLDIKIVHNTLEQLPIAPHFYRVEPCDVYTMEHVSKVRLHHHTVYALMSGEGQSLVLLAGVVSQTVVEVEALVALRCEG